MKLLQYPPKAVKDADEVSLGSKYLPLLCFFLQS
jgi:hypothetical protein